MIRTMKALKKYDPTMYKTGELRKVALASKTEGMKIKTRLKLAFACKCSSLLRR